MINSSKFYSLLISKEVLFTSDNLFRGDEKNRNIGMPTIARRRQDMTDSGHRSYICCLKTKKQQEKNYEVKDQLVVLLKRIIRRKQDLYQ